MKRTLVALIAGALASVAAAQSTTPSPHQREKQRDVQSVTQSRGDNSGNAQATAAEQARNVSASREVDKLSKADKTQLAKDALKLDVNPNNSSGVAATARMQTQTTAASKPTAKQNTEFKSKSGRAELDRELQKRSTP